MEKNKQIKILGAIHDIDLDTIAFLE